MEPIRKILAVIDPTTDKQLAVDRAAVLAGQFDAELVLFICDYNPALSGDVFFDSNRLKKAREGALRNRRRLAERLAAPLADEGLKVSVDAVWGKHYHEEIIRKAIDSKVDLVVKATKFHSHVRRALFSSSDWTLIRECPVPVLLTRLDSWAERPAIVVAVDPMHIEDKSHSFDNKLIDIANEFAELTAGVMHVAHWYSNPAQMALEVRAAVEAFPPGVLPSIHEKAFENLLEGREIQEDHRHLIEGSDKTVLPDLVDELDAQLVVMGAISRGRLERAIIGNTAERVLDHLSCDLLIVKPNELVHSTATGDGPSASAHPLAAADL